MSVKREQIIQRYVEELELNEDQVAVFCCLVELIPAKILVRPFALEDVAKGNSERATARKWGLSGAMVRRIANKEAAE
jgi:hypothetical protein